MRVIEVRIQDGAEIRQFNLLLSPPIGEGYRQRTSFNAFFHGDNEKNVSHDGLFKYVAEDATRKSTKQLPEIDVLDIWDLYRIIGFDWKNRIWIDEFGEQRAYVARGIPVDDGF